MEFSEDYPSKPPQCKCVVPAACGRVLPPPAVDTDAAARVSSPRAALLLPVCAVPSSSSPALAPLHRFEPKIFHPNSEGHTAEERAAALGCRLATAAQTR
jgi:hypothetical protein